MVFRFVISCENNIASPMLTDLCCIPIRVVRTLSQHFLPNVGKPVNNGLVVITNIISCFI